jgi:peroxiredoxin
MLGLAGIIGAGIYFGWVAFFDSDEVDLGDELSRELTPVNPTARPTATVLVPETGGQVDSLGEVVRVGSPAPDFTLKDLSGTVHSLIDHRNQVVLINFWTTWCPPCKEEMPALQEAYDRYQQRGFIVLGVNWTAVDDREQILPFVQELGLTFPILLDIDSVVSEDTYNLLGLPTTVFVDRNGIVTEVFIGALQLETLQLKIESMLEEIS